MSDTFDDHPDPHIVQKVPPRTGSFSVVYAKEYGLAHFSKSRLQLIAIDTFIELAWRIRRRSLRYRLSLRERALLGWGLISMIFGNFASVAT
jgi:hypothetical protein